MKTKKKEKCLALFLVSGPMDSAGCMGLGVVCYAVIFVRVVGEHCGWVGGKKTFHHYLRTCRKGNVEKGGGRVSVTRGGDWGGGGARGSSRHERVVAIEVHHFFSAGSSISGA